MEKEWFEKLTEAQKTKLRGLRESDELIAFCHQEHLELPDDLLDFVNGGNRPVPGYGADDWPDDCPHYWW